MSDGLNFWYGILIFLIIVGVLATIGGVLVAAAIRMSIRDDFFEDPDSL